MVMAPIGAAIASRADATRFATAVMLGIAFAATIGGMGSLIGTPPNAIFAAYVGRVHGVEIGFAQWAALGVPVALILLTVTWLVLARLTPGIGSSGLARVDTAAFGRMSFGEIAVAVIAGLTALAWISRPALEWALPGIGLSDAGIAMTAALVLFMVPAGGGGRLLSWQDVADLRWDVLILFGGGLSLAGIIDGSGLAAWIGDRAQALATLPRDRLHRDRGNRHRLPGRARQQHGHGRDLPADRRRSGGRAGNRSCRLHGPHRHGGLGRLHAAGRNPAERHRLQPPRRQACRHAQVPAPSSMLPGSLSWPR